MKAVRGLDTAPHAVVRAARWPVSSLLALVRPAFDIAEAAAAEPHAQRLRHELQLLWQHTLGCPAFRKALAVSHPGLYARLRHTSCPASWNKAARQLTATLYRHWARACWRTEPNGLWAGVGLAPLRPLQDGTEHDTLGRVAVAPHLQPFFDMLRALAQCPDYARHGRFKVHPSARREAPGVWLVRTLDAAGAERLRRLHLRHVEAQVADGCIQALTAQGPLPYAALVQVAARQMDPAIARSLVDQLMGAGLLVGGLCLPHLFDTAWEALDQAGGELQPGHRRAWESAVADLRALCRRLEHSHARLGADALWQADLEAARRIQALAAQLGVASPALPRASLHWDAGLPAAVRFDPVTLGRLQRALVAYERHHQRSDPVAALDQLYAQAHDQGRVAALRRSLAGHGDWHGLASALREQGGDGGLGARLASTHDDGGGEQPEVTPFGALMLRLGRDSSLVTGLSHEPWLSYARFGALLGRPGPHAHPLHAWCDRALGRFAHESQLRLAQLAAPCGPLANLLAQPRFGAARPLDPYGCTPGALPEAGAQLCHDARRRWLQLPCEPRPVLVLGASALDLGARDPLLERLLLTGWRYRPPVTAAALHDGGPVGEARRLDADLSRQRARWRLAGDAAMALAQSDPATRWAQWQALAGAWNLPEWVTVSRDGEPALPMPRDSALAVEVMFRAPGAATVAFEIEAPEDECWLTDLEGNCYATELILAFARERHAWNPGGGAVAAVPTEPGAPQAAVAQCEPG